MENQNSGRILFVGMLLFGPQVVVGATLSPFDLYVAGREREAKRAILEKGSAPTVAELALLSRIEYRQNHLKNAYVYSRQILFADPHNRFAKVMVGKLGPKMGNQRSRLDGLARQGEVAPSTANETAESTIAMAAPKKTTPPPVPVASAAVEPVKVPTPTPRIEAGEEKLFAGRGSFLSRPTNTTFNAPSSFLPQTDEGEGKGTPQVPAMASLLAEKGMETDPVATTKREIKDNLKDLLEGIEDEPPAPQPSVTENPGDRMSLSSTEVVDPAIERKLYSEFKPLRPTNATTEMVKEVEQRFLTSPMAEKPGKNKKQPGKRQDRKKVSEAVAVETTTPLPAERAVKSAYLSEEARAEEEAKMFARSGFQLGGSAPTLKVPMSPLEIDGVK